MLAIVSVYTYRESIHLTAALLRRYENGYVLENRTAVRIIKKVHRKCFKFRQLFAHSGCMQE
jgi:hypothetical protein